MPEEGLFQVIESFAIRSRKQFYFIGNLTTGTMQKGWFLEVPFNSSLGMTIRIHLLEEVESSAYKENLTLLIVNCENIAIDIFLGLNINFETLKFQNHGEDSH